jgi:hypothetical protein
MRLLAQKFTKIGIIAFSILIASAVTPVQAQPSNDAVPAAIRGAVQQAVERYFRAADAGDPQAVRDAFLPNARVEGVIGGKFTSWTIDEFATQNFRGKPSNTDQTMRRTIEWLDVSGPAAVVRVKVDAGASSEYWDYFILFQIDGRWKISKKLFANPAKS